mmetsp:Transcript_11103/g.18623  ORF Transcript_11103/g.18623 Transcript_11103/m.18623 type:complete len:97 (+) Transcript_11103:1054-1344(+)
MGSSDSGSRHSSESSGEREALGSQSKLKNSIFEKIFKAKNKDWSYQNHLSQFRDTGCLDDYERGEVVSAPHGSTNKQLFQKYYQADANSEFDLEMD